MDFNSQLTDHFKLSEFVRTCHNESKLHLEFLSEADKVSKKTGIDFFVRIKQLALVLEIIRSEVYCPIYITSGYRSSRVNCIVNGSPTSQHRTCGAVDFCCPSIDINSFANIVKRVLSEHNINYDQLIIYPKRNFIHLGLSRYSLSSALSLRRRNQCFTK